MFNSSLFPLNVVTSVGISNLSPNYNVDCNGSCTEFLSINYALNVSTL